MNENVHSYLQIYLGPLAPLLARPDVTDVYINKPSEMWVETLGGKIEQHEVVGITEPLLWRLAHQIASLTHQGINREHPLLAARLPDGARVQVIAPPATRGPLALAIRKHVSADLSLDDYEGQGAFTGTSNGTADAADDELERLYASRSWGAFLRAAVRARKTIVVSGGTSTGKTTFLNALLREVSDAERLILIEDTPELNIAHPNAVGLVAVRGALGEASVTPEDLLTASLRMRPDRIVLGELRGGEAFTFLRAVNTGHPGSMTTVHADTPARAIEQIAMLVTRSGAGMPYADTTAYIGRVVDIIVQLERHAGARRVQAISWRHQGADRAS